MTCERCNGKGWVWVAEDVEEDCPACENEQAAIRAEVHADLDLLHAAAARYMAAGIDPQLSYDMARHDRRR